MNEIKTNQDSQNKNMPIPKNDSVGKPTDADEAHWNQELDKWKKRISYMELYFKEAQERHGWKNHTKYLWGKVSQSLSISQTIVTVNDVFAFIKTSVASLYSKNPYIAINPKKSSETQSAIIKEQIINYKWKELCLKRYIKKCILEAKLVGHSWIKGGYEADIEQVEAEDEDGNPVTGDIQEQISGERVWSIHIPYSEVYYDPEAKDAPYDCRWIEHHYLKPVAYLEKKYGIKGIEPTHKPNEENDKKKNLADCDIEMTMVHEIWDKDDGYKKVYCEGYDGWLDRVPPCEKDCVGPYELKGLPFKMLKFNDFPSMDGKDNFPMSDIESWVDQFLEKIKIRSAQLDHVKRYNRQVLYDKNKIKPEDMENFIKGAAGSNIGVDGNPSEIMASAPYPPIATDAYAVESKIDQDKDRISGMAGFQQGGSTSTRTRTLGELDQMSAGTDNRKQEQIDIVEDFCVEVAKMLLDLEKQFSDVEKITRVIGEVPKEWLKKLADEGKFDGQSITYTKEDIQGEEDVDIKAGSSLPMNKENRIATCIQIARFGPAFGLAPGTFASIELGRQLMRDMELVAVERAYDRDIANMMKQMEQPNPQSQIKDAKAMADLKKINVDTNLKEQRTISTNLSNVGKAVKNAREMREFSNIGQG